MSKTRRRFGRPLGERRYRKLFVISTEGDITEPSYFGLFNSETAVVHVTCVRSGSKSSPDHVLKRMKARLRKEPLRAGDEA